MKGDRIVILVDAGGTEAREFIVEAMKTGRTVEAQPPRSGQVVVEELTRTHRTVRKAMFMATRVVALIELKAEPEGEDDDRKSHTEAEAREGRGDPDDVRQDGPAAEL